MNTTAPLPSADVAHTHCANCKTQLPQPITQFCPHCGQETRLRPPTIGEFLQQFGGAFFSTEGALWRSMWRLFVPGELTREYFAGRRRHFVLPLRLYLTISVLALLILRIYTGTVLEEGKQNLVQIDTKPGQNTISIIDVPGYRMAMTPPKGFVCEGFSTSVCQRVERRLDPKNLPAEVLEGQVRFFNHASTAMFVLLPIFAIWLKLIFIDKRRHYTEHLVFALHLHAFWFLMVPLLLVPIPAIQIAAVTAIMIYPLVAIQRVYRTRWWSTLMRGFGLFLLSLITDSLALAGVFMWTLVS